MSWPVLIVAAVFGAAALALAVVADRRSRRRATEPPDREIPGFSQQAPPRYLSAAEANQPATSRTAPTTDDLDVDQARLTLPAGWADHRFGNDQSRAVLRGPLVVVVDAIGSIREALPILEQVRHRDRGLVLVAGEVEADSLDTLAVNAVQDLLAVVVVEADAETRQQIATTLGCRPLDRITLQAGWVPDDAVVPVRAWVSTESGSWVFLDDA